MSKPEKKVEVEEIKEEKEIKEKILTEEEKKELVKQEKKNKRGERTLFGKIVNVILWIVVLGWMALFIIEFIKVQNEKDPIFCIKKTTIKSGTGTAKVCTGLGYKVYNYNCSNNKHNYNGAVEFGPFWTKSICDKEVED